MYIADTLAIRLEGMRFEMDTSSPTMLSSILLESGSIEISTEGAKRVRVAVNEDAPEVTQRMLQQGTALERTDSSRYFFNITLPSDVMLPPYCAPCI